MKLKYVLNLVLIVLSNFIFCEKLRNNINTRRNKSKNDLPHHHNRHQSHSSGLGLNSGKEISNYDHKQIIQKLNYRTHQNENVSFSEESRVRK